MSKVISHIQLTKISTPGRYFDPSLPGLHLWVRNAQRKYWVFRFMVRGKRQDMGLGPFPRIGLADARRAALVARGLLDQNINPIEARRNQRAPEAQQSTKRLICFREFATDWLANKQPEWKNSKHAAQWTSTLENYAYPIIGDKTLADIGTEDILAILRPIWLTKTETASRLRGRLERTLAAAATRGLRSGINPAAWRGHLDNLLPVPKRISKVQHHAALPYSDVPAFIEHLRQRNGIAPLMLEFLILTAARTGEVLGARRSEVENDLWMIPANRMKAQKEHRVPLTPRAIEILAIARSLDAKSEFLFSINSRPLSNMAMFKLIKRLNLPITVHGFRSAFRDWVAETTNYPSELAEMALAHTIANKVEAAYRRGDLLVRRRQLMLDWATFCERAAAARVFPFRAA
jgi:integrase